MGGESSGRTDPSPGRRKSDSTLLVTLRVLYNLGIAYFHQYEWKAYKRAVACLKDATDIARLISGSFHPSASNCYRDQFWLR